MTAGECESGKAKQEKSNRSGVWNRIPRAVNKIQIPPGSVLAPCPPRSWSWTLSSPVPGAQTQREANRSLSKAPDLMVSLSWTPLSLQQQTQQFCISPISSPDFCPAQHLASKSLISLHPLPLYPTVSPCLFLPKPAKIFLSPSNSSPYIMQGASCLHHFFTQHVGLRLSWEPRVLGLLLWLGIGVCHPHNVPLCSSVCRVKAFNHRS